MHMDKSSLNGSEQPKTSHHVEHEPSAKLQNNLTQKRSKSEIKSIKSTSGSDGSLYKKRPKVFGIGRSIPPKRDLHRFVRWPKYVRLQRQRRVIYERLKVPHALAQFSNALEYNQACSLCKLLMKYRPENKATKKQRLLEESNLNARKEVVLKKRPLLIKYGINHITQLVESKKAQLIVIAHDVDPIEIVCWLPALCKKMGIPYVILKGKARLGSFVNKKTAAALALVGVRGDDSRELTNIVEISDKKYLGELNLPWGEGTLGYKARMRQKKH
jgi:large subunit ribosomal protein L7Ae